MSTLTTTGGTPPGTVSGGGPGDNAASTGQPWWRVPLSVWCFVLGLAANIFSGHAGELGLPIGLDRILLPAALLLAFLDRRYAWWRLRSAHIAMMIFALIATASYVTIGYRAGLESVFTLLDRVYLPFLLFASGPFFLGTGARRDLLTRMLTVVGIYLTITTLLEAAGALGLLFPRYIAAFHAAGALDLTSGAGEEATRAGGPFLSGEANGMALAMCAYAAILLASRSTGTWRLVAMVTGPAALIASVATLTRSIWLGIVLGLVAMAMTRWDWFRWLPVGALLLALVLGAGALAFPEFAADVSERASSSRSLWDRVTTNDAAVRIIAERPLTGIGWQQFLYEGGDYARQADTVPLANTSIEVHNVFLSRGAELGIPGLLAFVLAVVTGPVAALCRRIREDLVPWQLILLGSAALWGIVSMTSPNPYPFPTFLLWTIAGFVLSAPGPAAPRPATGS